MLISETLIDVQCILVKCTYSQFKRMSFISSVSIPFCNCYEAPDLRIYSNEYKLYNTSTSVLCGPSFSIQCCLLLFFFIFFFLFNIYLYNCYFPLSRVGALKDILRSLVDSFESNVT